MGMPHRPNLMRPRSRTHIDQSATSKQFRPHDPANILGSHMPFDRVIANEGHLGQSRVIRSLSKQHSNAISIETNNFSRRVRRLSATDSLLEPKTPKELISPAKKVILLGGQQLEIIQKSQFLRQHFCL
jgi:hypothetical protein